MIWLHRRLLGGIALGAIGTIGAAMLGAPAQARVLIGWNIGAAGYLAAVWFLYTHASEEEVRARAANQDEPQAVILILALIAIGASLTGIVAALMSVKAQPAAERALVAALAALTLLSSWFVVQSLFVGHYAHRHFQAIARDGDKAGFVFPGDPPRSYLDFAYLAICVGATAQVSDPGVQTTGLRNLVTVHAVTSFVYNTAILATGINILSGLFGH